MITYNPTPEGLALIAGVLLSLFFSYVPKVSDWYYTLSDNWKRLLMLVALLLSSLGIFGLACAAVLTGVTCDQAGAWRLAIDFILAVISNQGTNGISPRTGARSALAKFVRAEKAAAKANAKLIPPAKL